MKLRKRTCLAVALLSGIVMGAFLGDKINFLPFGGMSETVGNTPIQKGEEPSTQSNSIVQSEAAVEQTEKQITPSSNLTTENYLFNFASSNWPWITILFFTACALALVNEAVEKKKTAKGPFEAGVQSKKNAGIPTSSAHIICHNINTQYERLLSYWDRHFYYPNGEYERSLLCEEWFKEKKPVIPVEEVDRSLMYFDYLNWRSKKEESYKLEYDELMESNPQILNNDWWNGFYRNWLRKEMEREAIEDEIANGETWTTEEEQEPNKDASYYGSTDSSNSSSSDTSSSSTPKTFADYYDNYDPTGSRNHSGGPPGGGD